MFILRGFANYHLLTKFLLNNHSSHPNPGKQTATVVCKGTSGNAEWYLWSSGGNYVDSLREKNGCDYEKPFKKMQQ